MFKTTAFDIWREEQQMRKLITLCSDLDKQLGGGIERGKIVEFCGGPGTGKTQMCLQLCITVQFPSDAGGLGGKAIFIDTNQDFSPERLKEIADHLSQRFQKVFQDKPSKANFYLDNLLNNIGYHYCADICTLIATIVRLKETLKRDPQLKLIVIDSYSHLIRQMDEDVSERTRISYEILTDLQKLAIEYGVAVVLTNELTTGFDQKDWRVYPALGNTHLHKINQRIILSQNVEAGLRFAFISKSVNAPRVDVPFKLKENGLRGFNAS